MLRTLTSVWMCAVVLFFGGCKDKPKPEVTEKKRAAPLAGLPMAANIAEQLQGEAAARPKEALRTETVIEALAKAQIALTDNKQFIARTVLANYCFGGTTAQATAVTVCEYSSVEAAKEGLEHSQKQFVGIPNRTLTQNKQTVLTLVRGMDTPQTKAEAEKAIEVFSKL